MALFKKTEFAAKCGLSTGNLANYIKRGKVKVMENGMIDDHDLINSEFIKRREGQKKNDGRQEKTRKMTVSAGKTPEKHPELSTGTPDQPETAQSDQKTAEMTQNPGKTPEVLELYELEKARKIQDIENRQQDKLLKRFQIERIQGKLIPTDLVRILFAQVFRENNLGFKQAVEALLTEMAAKHRWNANELAEWRGRAVRTLNDSINRSVEAAKVGVDRIVLEYSQSKST